MIKIENIKVPICFTETDIINQISKNLRVKKTDILNYEIIKKSIDARKKPEIFYVLTVGANLISNLEKKFEDLKFEIDYSVLNYKKINYKTRPVVVGFGPSGMFCALMLSRMGLKPIVIEQGKQIEKRDEDVQNFWSTGKLNEFSNVQFGEGGAGTFSDGKLNTTLNNIYCKKVLNEFYFKGAPKDILINNKPHIGTDNLKKIVKNIRAEIIENGGEILFSHKFLDLNLQNNQLSSIKVLNLETNETIELTADYLILALGHSAGDTFTMLYNKGILMKQKPFSMGVRIEQLQKDINESQYGKNYDKSLPNADYKLFEHLPNGRTIYTFCNCPGGEIVASSSNNDRLVTNGMSYYKRDNKFCNSAVLVNVNVTDYESESPLSGLDFQAKYETLAYFLGGGNHVAPAQTADSFLNGSQNIIVSTTYRPKVKFTELQNCLPNFVTESLKLGLPILNQKLKNFAKKDNVLIGIESRSSCPLFILRDEKYCSNILGIYPTGEGSGYAGGIVSSAQDGIKIAEQIYNEILLLIKQ